MKSMKEKKQEKNSEKKQEKKPEKQVTETKEVVSIKQILRIIQANSYVCEIGYSTTDINAYSMLSFHRPLCRSVN